MHIFAIKNVQIADEKIKINCHISSKPKFEEKHISAEKNPDILNADLLFINIFYHVPNFKS